MRSAHHRAGRWQCRRTRDDPEIHLLGTALTHDLDEPVRSTAHHPAPPTRSIALTLLIAAGAFGIILVAIDSELFDLDRHAVPKEFVLHLVALLALPALARGSRRIEADVVTVTLAAFVAWSALSMLFATNHGIALRAFGLSFSAFIVFLTARRIARAGTSRFAVTLLAAAATTGAMIGAAQAYGLDLPLLANERAPGGTFGNRNFLAHLTVTAMPLLVLCTVRARHRVTTALGLVGLAACANAIVLTRSRAAWLGLAAAAAVFIILALARRVASPGPGLIARGGSQERPGSDNAEPRSRTRRSVQRITLAIALGAASAIIVPNRLEWRSDSPYAETLTRIADYRSGSGRGRLIQYQNSLQLVKQDPLFGTGPGNWFVKYPLVTTANDPSYAASDPIPTNPWPSSDWVALIVERGVIGLLLVLLAGVSITIVSIMRIRGDDAAPAHDALALLCLLTAASVTGAFDAVLLNTPPLYFVAAAAGLLLPPLRPVIVRPLEDRRRVLLPGVTVAVLLLLLIGTGRRFAAIRITADSQNRAVVEHALSIDPGNYRLRLLLARNGPCRSRIEHARAALRLLPHHAAARRALAACGSAGV